MRGGLNDGFNDGLNDDFKVSMAYIKPKRILAIDTSCVIIQVDILGLYTRKEIGDVIFGFVS